MKKLAIGLTCISLLLTLVVPTTAKGKSTESTYLTNKDKLYQIQKPGRGWRKESPGKFNDYCFVRHDRSTIYIGSRIYSTSLEEFDLSATQHSWIQGMEEKYKWTNVKIIDEADTTIDEHPAFWSITEFTSRGRPAKEKIYLVQSDEFYYRLRLSCPKRYFNKHLEEFEQLVKSFKLLSFKVPAQASDWRNLEKKLNPERKRLWIVVGDKEASGFVHNAMERYRIPTHGFGGIFIAAVEGLAQSSYPLIATFSPDQKSLEKIEPKYHYLFVIPKSEVEKILAENKCVIVSGKVKINVVRQTLDDQGQWTVASETEEESYITLIAAPNKRALKKAVARFFTLSEIPLEPLIFAAK